MPGWGARRKHPRDPAPADPKEQAELAREEQFYAIDNPGSLDGPGLMRALMIYRHHSIYQQLATLGNRYTWRDWRWWSMKHRMAGGAIGPRHP